MEAVAKQSCQPYQVFINHRGEDTKKNIASLIYHALEPYGLRVFLDQYVLTPGDTIETEIRRAISSSSVHIAIFSKNYAESRWCLNELLWMLKSSHGPKFIPIFCDVEPVELRFIKKGCYAKAFQKHLARESKELVDEWVKILRKAADISGKVFKGKKALGEAAGTSDTVFNWKESDYGKLVKNIENIVIEHVKRDPLELPPRPVGLDQAWKDLDDQIKKQSSKKVVVIAGLGGIGKSTLARHIFNELSRSEFRRAAYLFNVRERDDHDLQRQLWRHLLGKNMSDSWRWRDGKTMLRNSLKGLKVLIVFDDVDQWDKIERVLDVHAVEEGSLIFVTSRDKDVVGASYKNTSFVYDVQPLKNKHARELFCYHATRQSNSLEGCADLVEDFLEICGGLPLCLQVLGEQLSSSSDRTHWERQLKLYSEGASLPGADDVINKLLKWSCEDMDSERRRMLLDVAYFLVGEDKELAVQVLEGLDYMKDVHYSLKRLCETYLVSFKNDVDYHHDKTKIWLQSKRWLQFMMGHFGMRVGPQDWEHFTKEVSQSLSLGLTKRSSKLIMHNQVREMARCIVRENQSEPLRLRCAVDFEKQSGSVSRPIRGICIREDQSPSRLPMDINMTGVRLLVVEHPIDDLSRFLGSISGNLVWLRWRVSPFISLPRTISVKNLRVLELQGPQNVHLEDFFSSIDEIPLDLRVLHMDCTKHASSSTSSSAQPVDLQHSKKSFDGNSFSFDGSSVLRFLRWIGTSMQNLTQIVLNINSESLPFDFSELKMLRHLDLSGSSNLTALPNSFSKLLQLQHLALRDCANLDIPVDILGEISTLEHIDFKGCVQLVHLPQGIASQRRLRYLNLLHTSLLELPLTLEPPSELEQLIIGSNRFRELACSVAFLGKLKELFLVGCFELRHISMPIEQLTCLERLEIYGCEVRILPAGISLLKHLKVLTIISCPIRNFSLDNNVMDALTDLTLTHTAISDLSIPAGACPMLSLVVMSFLIPDPFFLFWGNYIAFTGAMLFLMLGLVLLVDLAHNWAEYCLMQIEDTDSRVWRFVLIGSTLSMYLGSIAMTVVQYVFFARGTCSLNQATITINLILWLAVSVISVNPTIQEYNSKAGLAQAAMVAVYCTYLTMSAVSMEPDDNQCNPLVRAQGTRTTSVVIGAIVTMLTVAYTTTRAATQSLGLGNSNGIRLPEEDEHDLVTQQPAARREMRAEALRRAVEEGSLPADALDSDDDDDDSASGGHPSHDDERSQTQYSYSVFHIIFFLATAWVATLLTMNFEEATKNGDFATVGRTYAASYVKIASSWICYGMYTWTLVAPIVLPDRFDFS